MSNEGHGQSDASGGHHANHGISPSGDAPSSGSGSATRATSLQNYHLLAFRKALHPEFFGIESRQ
ncbi:MAG: hypothetical protein ACKOYN_06055, partial [Planctomycetota bacterium]